MKSTAFPVHIKIEENHSLSRTKMPVRLGIPFSCSAIFNPHKLSLLDENNNSIPLQTKITAHWHDDSIRWLLIDFCVSCKANETIEYTLVANQKQTDKYISPLSFSEQSNKIIIKTGVAEFHINKSTFQPFLKIITGDTNQQIESSDCLLAITDNTKLKANIDEIILPDQIAPIRTTIYIDGSFPSVDKGHILHFKSSLTFFANSPLCEIDFTLHNPNAARHPGGFWDLGDPGSTFFKSLVLSLKLSLQPKILWKNIGDSVYQSLKHKEFRLYQDSSGGKNWNHSIHIDKDRQSTVSFRGYQLKADNKIIESGNRVSPVLFFNNIASNLRVHIKQFWQNFPKAISANGKQINLEIFPETLKSDFELQGGEQKTHTIFLDFNSKDDLLEQMVTPLKVTLPLSHYADTSALPWLPSVLKSTELDKVILAGIEGEQNFFNKREKADEYGWRNFGELWADHETLEHGYDDKRVSHYNNQYDPVYGFFRQFILSGDQRFLELMDNLAKHVIDIDIYHTDKDRPEYNAGLFWHTDHYMDAGTCSHRTTSRQHMEADHVEQSGGGPSDEHCYTSGFMYHYFHTGHIKSKEAVVSLTHWIMRRIEGDRTVLDRLNSFFKQDLKAIKSLLSGEKILNYQYAFHRGTGNYINSLLDAYTVTDDPKYIEKVESVIKNTMSPQDDIQLRDLRDIELRWSYTVLLQSLCKYLSIRKNTPDKCFEFIRDCLLHYAWWMLENEKPYLETPELLVYPNDTWVAQDIRKAYIFYCAYQLTTDLNFLQASKDFFTYVNDNLNTKQVLKSSRILAILMQSHFHPDIQLKFPTMEKNEVINTGAKVNFSVSNILINFLLDVLKRLTNLSVRNEYQWFRQRFFNR